LRSHFTRSHANIREDLTISSQKEGITKRGQGKATPNTNFIFRKIKPGHRKRACPKRGKESRIKLRKKKHPLKYQTGLRESLSCQNDIL